MVLVRTLVRIDYFKYELSIKKSTRGTEWMFVKERIIIGVIIHDKYTKYFNIITAIIKVK